MAPKKRKTLQKTTKDISKVSGSPEISEPAQPTHGDESPCASTTKLISSRTGDVDSDSISLASPSSIRGLPKGSWSRKSGPHTQVARETILASKASSGRLAADLSRFEPKKAPSPAVESEDGKARRSIGGSNKVGEVSSQPTEHDNTSQKDSGTPSQTAVNDTLDRSASQPEASGPSNTSTWRGWFSAPSTTQQTSGSESSTAGDGATATQSKDLGSTKDTKIAQHAPSWFGLWSSAATTTTNEHAEAVVPKIPIADTPSDGEPEATTSAATSYSQSQEPPKASTWAFWSRQPPRSDDKTCKESDEGQLVISDQTADAKPVPAHTVNKPKTNQTAEIEPPLKKVQMSAPDAAQIQEPSSAKGSPAPSIIQSKTTAPHLLLPEFKSTYRLKESPGILQQIARLIMHTQQPAANHVYLVKEPPRIKKALAIGIHGLFPASFLRPVIGQPTGTSIRFATHAANAIQRWTEAHGFECEVEKVALEGEGKIGERVDNLWKLLLNWVDHVRQSDFILVACHSQGVPVALMLVAKLLEFGVVSSAKIGICAMAGVSLGPFAEYKARFFGGSTAELFDFADPKSEVSQRYEQSLRIALNYGVRITYVGSIDDQLVSLESAIFSPVNHPYIYRAVFVDGRVHAPDFIAHLVGFALKLRNLGVTDHGLIRELSAPLAGSLYTGVGHSSLYDETRIYDLAISFALETSSVKDVPLHIQKYSSPAQSNPFQLPWSMRGLLEEDVVKTELDDETQQLLRQFDEWKPVTKGLKDVKYRLEAVKSKL